MVVDIIIQAGSGSNLKDEIEIGTKLCDGDQVLM